MTHDKSKLGGGNGDLSKLADAVDASAFKSANTVLGRAVGEHARVSKALTRNIVPPSIQKAIDAMNFLPKHIPISETIKNLKVPLNTLDSAKLFGPDSPSGRINALIQSQQKLIDSLKLEKPVLDSSNMKALDDLRSIRNPAYDTNEKIDRLVEIGQNGVLINDALQKKFDAFLADFNNAASSSNKSSNVAIMVAVIAVVISIITFIYSEFWRGPQQDEKSSQQISFITGKIDENSRIQILTSEKIANSLEVSNQENAELLRQIAKLLEAQADKQSTPPKPTE